MEKVAGDWVVKEAKIPMVTGMKWQKKGNSHEGATQAWEEATARLIKGECMYLARVQKETSDRVNMVRIWTEQERRK